MTAALSVRLIGSGDTASLFGKSGVIADWFTRQAVVVIFRLSDGFLVLQQQTLAER